MRMWMINPKLLCRKHLFGCHFELHKHRPGFVKQYSINGRIFPVVQIEPKSMQKRHDQLVKEMKRRGYNHNSPYIQPDLSYLTKELRNAKVDVTISIRELKERCADCRKLIEGE